MTGRLTCICFYIPDGAHFPFPDANAGAGNHWGCSYEIPLQQNCTHKVEQHMCIVRPSLKGYELHVSVFKAKNVKKINKSKNK